MIGLTTLCRLAYLAFNPFSEYRNTKKDKDRGCLLRSELEQLVTFNCEKKKNELVKDLLVFSCFYRAFLFGYKRIEKQQSSGVF